jgi:hypothetical protein
MQKTTWGANDSMHLFRSLSHHCAPPGAVGVIVACATIPPAVPSSVVGVGVSSGCQSTCCPPCSWWRWVPGVGCLHCAPSCCHLGSSWFLSLFVVVVVPSRCCPFVLCCPVVQLWPLLSCHHCCCCWHPPLEIRQTRA